MAKYLNIAKSRGVRTEATINVRAKKERKDAEEFDLLAPLCRADVEKGIEHVLSLKNKERKDILRVHFGITSAFFNGAEKPLYKLLLVETEIELRRLMQLPPLLTGDIYFKNKDEEEHAENGGEPYAVAEM